MLGPLPKIWLEMTSCDTKLLGHPNSDRNILWVLQLALDDSVFFRTLSCCQYNAIHCMGQNTKSLAACVCVRAPDLGSEYIENDTNRKWHMADWLVTWPMTSRDPESSRSSLRYIWMQISRKRLKIEIRFQWDWMVSAKFYHPDLDAMATKFETKTAITRLVKEISEIFSSNRGYWRSSYRKVSVTL